MKPHSKRSKQRAKQYAEQLAKKRDVVKDSVSTPKTPSKLFKLISTTSFALLILGILTITISQIGDVPSYEAQDNWEATYSEQQWEFWDQALLDSMAKTMQFLHSANIDEMVKNQSKQVENLNIQTHKQHLVKELRNTQSLYEKLHVKLDNFRDKKIYRRYIKTFVWWYRFSSEDDQNKSLEDRFTFAIRDINNVEDFLANIEYSLKIEQEYGITMAHTGRRFIWSDIKQIYYDLHKLPTFTVRSSGLKVISLREIMEGAAAQMDNHEMAGEFGKYQFSSSNIQHELTHALDEHRGLEFNDPGWLNLNREATPYAYNWGSQAIWANNRNPNAPHLQSPEPGYAYRYGQQGGILEDKATVSELLLTHHNIGELINRTITDPILKKKVEFMAGYHLDNPASVKLGRKLTETEKLEYHPHMQIIGDLWMYLFNPHPLQQQALQKFFSDENFRKGVEAINGYKVETVYNFGSPVTDQEYLENGFAERNYWSVWSKDSKGIIWMDADYYNALLREENVSFSEEAGNTKRTIKPPVKGV